MMPTHPAVRLTIIAEGGLEPAPKSSSNEPVREGYPWKKSHQVWVHMAVDMAIETDRTLKKCCPLPQPDVFDTIMEE